MRIIRNSVIILSIIAVIIFTFSAISDFYSQDKTIPVITTDCELLEVSGYEEAELMHGLHAFDEKDGDLTSQIMIGKTSKIQKDGSFNMTYVVFDSANHSATLTRKIIIKDYISPRFYTEEPLVLTKGKTVDILKDYIRAYDMLDGDLTNYVKVIDSDVNFNVPGKYQFIVEVANSLGDISKIVLPVHIVDSYNFKLNIAFKKNIVYLKKGDYFNPYSYVDSIVQADGTKIDRNVLSIDSEVKTQESGIYEVKYTAENEDHDMDVKWLTIIVED